MVGTVSGHNYKENGDSELKGLVIEIKVLI
jgi:hypothetical protein